jgi:hypothetical protein
MKLKLANKYVNLVPSILSAVTLVGFIGASFAAPVLVNSVSIAGNATDLGGGTSANQNRLGGFFSDVVYDSGTGSLYALPDRGPGGGLVSYDTRVQTFGLTVNPTTGAISNLTLQATTKLTQNGQAFNGLNPALSSGTVSGTASTLGRSLDPEGLVKAPSGNYFVADEYGPRVAEFKADGTWLRDLSTPSNLQPRNLSGQLEYVLGRRTSTVPNGVATGRQDNRGFEGLAITPDGKNLVGIMQDPLVNEGLTGTTADGRFSQNLRIVTFNVATGQATGQYAYQTEALSSINSRLPAGQTFTNGNSQGRNIGVSSITAISNTEFVVLERDNRGVGVDDPTGLTPSGSKRLYTINLAGATDISNVSLAGTNTLPAGVVPVSKTLYYDILAALTQAGLVVPEKLEAFTFGPRLTDGSLTFFVGSDNDFSVTQTGTGQQFDVCVNAAGSVQTALGAGCPTGYSLIPTYLFAFRAPASDFPTLTPLISGSVPLPGTALLMAFGLIAFFKRNSITKLAS